MQFIIRPGTETDLPAMVALWRQMMDYHAELDPCFRPRSSPAGEDAWADYLRKEILTGENWCVLLAEANGTLIGQILGELREVPPVFDAQVYGYVTNIMVAGEVRRRGAGRALFQSLREWMRERGAEHLQLQVLVENDVSQAFWRATGCSDYSDTLWYDLEG